MHRYALRPRLLLLTLLATGCAEGVNSTSPRNEDGALLAKGGPGVSVTASDPSYGYKGDVAKRVIITGSGFAAGAVAAWERNGVPDPKVTVLSTQVLSSTEIEATISIAPDAELAFYDISVTSSKGKGVGTEMFEVTTAELLGTGTLTGGNTRAHAVNERGDATGWSLTSRSGSRSHAFYYESISNTLFDLGEGPDRCASTTGNGIDPSGNIIVGHSTGTNCNFALVWTRAGAGAPWLPAAKLPHRDASEGGADALAHVATRGATVAAGYLTYSGERRPTFWLLSDGTPTWSEPITLPFPGTGGRIRAVGMSGTFAGNVGMSDGQYAAVWDNASSLTVLQPAVGTSPNCFVHALSPQGMFAVGECARPGGSTAVYWTRASDGGWNTQGQELVPWAGRAWGVNDAGVVVGQGALAWQIGVPGAITLSGLGDNGVSSSARAITNSFPAIIVGAASRKSTTATGTRAVRWIQYWASAQ